MKLFKNAQKHYRSAVLWSKAKKKTFCAEQEQSEAHNGGTHDGHESEIVLPQHASLPPLMEFLDRGFSHFCPYAISLSAKRKMSFKADVCVEISLQSSSKSLLRNMFIAPQCLGVIVAYKHPGVQFSPPTPLLPLLGYTIA